MRNEPSPESVEWVPDLEWIEQDEAVDTLIGHVLVPQDEDAGVSETDRAA